jgi:hypothetical protein
MPDRLLVERTSAGVMLAMAWQHRRTWKRPRDPQTSLLSPQMKKMTVTMDACLALQQRGLADLIGGAWCFSTKVIPCNARNAYGMAVSYFLRLWLLGRLVTDSLQCLCLSERVKQSQAMDSRAQGAQVKGCCGTSEEGKAEDVLAPN